MKRLLFCILGLSVSLLLLAQKKPLEHADYDHWKSLSGASITADGNWVSYTINPLQGDGFLYLYDAKSGSLDSLERGTRARFSHSDDLLVFMVEPTYNETRQAKKEKKKKDQMPKSDLGIWKLGDDQPLLIEQVKSFQLADKGDAWVAYLMEKEEPKKKEKAEEGEAEADKEKKAEKPKVKQKGTKLVVTNPIEGKEYTYEDVTEYTFSENGEWLAILQTVTDTAKTDHLTLRLFSTSDEKDHIAFEGEGKAAGLTLSKTGANMAFMHTSDTGDVQIYDLYAGKTAEGLARVMVNEKTAGMPESWSVSENGNLRFSDSENRLFFGTAPAPHAEPEDTLLADEKYRLDIWSWHDKMLQPQQKVQLNRLKNRNYMAVYHMKDGKMVQLADEEMSGISLLKTGDHNLAVGTSNEPYMMLSSWDATSYADVYFVDVLTGKREMLMEKQGNAYARLSPDGKYLVYWNIEDRCFYAMDTKTRKTLNLTKQIPYAMHNELHDSPSEPRPYGNVGWLEGEEALLLKDRYDIWKVDLSGEEAAVNLTAGYGRDKHISFDYIKLDRDADYIGKKEVMLLRAFNEQTKASGFYRKDVRRAGNPEKIRMADASQRFYGKAEEADVYMWSEGTYVQYPELRISDENFANAEIISVTNPQQKDYIWGTTELVEWESFDHETLQGILYKPENFDPSKKYPMVVYFYERSSDGLHGYIAPRPSASTINRTYAVSNGYLVFVPDIPYTIGYPGRSCYNAVVSGTQSLLERYDYIDETKLGLDGQSWGGYQIAYLVTRTDMFACAFSGAPVSNMTSAYGGIRWGSGMSRMFQYEQTQSRIGGTLWEKPFHYIENSPIFFMPDINTPLLIMHNDNDGAVPWYQGIEYFVSLRRLGKPAWLLSYNDEEHNLRRTPNRKDLSVRKMQFFDHYLMDKPMPYWMKKGISQLEKGKKDGYELMK